MNKNIYIAQLEQAQQDYIEDELRNYLYQEFQLVDEAMEEAVEEGMASRLSDLEYIVLEEEA